MLKLKVVKVVKPELVGSYTNYQETIFEYRCSCGYGVGEGDRFCSCCGNELDWTGMNRISRNFQNFINSL